MNWRQELTSLLRRASLGKGQPTQPTSSEGGGKPASALDWSVGQLAEFHSRLLGNPSDSVTRGELASAIGLMANVLDQILIEQHREEGRHFALPPAAVEDPEEVADPNAPPPKPLDEDEEKLTNRL